MTAPSQTIWLLHGAVGLPNQWNRTLELLKDRNLACKKVDLLRYLDGGALSFEDWASAFHQEVAHEGAHRNYLVGYSLGGRLALHALIAKSELWNGAVILGAHPGLIDADERLRRMASDAEWAGMALTAPWAKFLEAWDRQSILGTPAAAEGCEDERLSLESRRHAIARSFMEWTLGKQKDLRQELVSVDCPLLWMTGERDGKFTELAEEIVPNLSEGEHLIIAGAGHRLLAEAPDKVAAGITSLVEADIAEGEDN